MEIEKHIGPVLLSTDRISLSFGGVKALIDVSAAVREHEILGIIGPNGAGKTTLVNCLLGHVKPDSGSVRVGSRLSIGYYRQIPHDLDLTMEVWRYLQSVIVGLDGQTRASEQQARDLAGAFLFSGAEQDKILGDLSGGERARAVLAGLVAGAHNLLVLDEPSNHLDIPSAERLEEAVSSAGGYQGTLLMVTHDRALIDATCTELLILDGVGGARQFHGGYSQWAQRTEAEASQRAEATAAAAPKRRRKKKAAPAAGREPLDRLERRIEKIEHSIGEIDSSLLEPDVYMDGARCRDLQARRAQLRDELSPLETEWGQRAGEEG